MSAKIRPVRANISKEGHQRSLLMSIHPSSVSRVREALASLEQRRSRRRQCQAKQVQAGNLMPEPCTASVASKSGSSGSSQATQSTCLSQPTTGAANIAGSCSGQGPARGADSLAQVNHRLVRIRKYRVQPTTVRSDAHSSDSTTIFGTGGARRDAAGPAFNGMLQGLLRAHSILKRTTKAPDEIKCVSQFCSACA